MWEDVKRSSATLSSRFTRAVRPRCGSPLTGGPNRSGHGKGRSPASIHALNLLYSHCRCLLDQHPRAASDTGGTTRGARKTMVPKITTTTPTTWAGNRSGERSIAGSAGYKPALASADAESSTTAAIQPHRVRPGSRSPRRCCHTTPRSREPRPRQRIGTLSRRHRCYRGAQSRGSSLTRTTPSKTTRGPR